MSYLLKLARSRVGEVVWPILGTVILFAGSQVMTATSGFGKTPGQRYCFNRTCHRVLTLDETHRRVGTPTTAIASYYRDCKVDRYNPCGLTSSGTVFRPGRADNAASPIYPNGTKLFVWNPATRRAAIVRIDNAGPYKGKRTLDLSVAAAEKLGFRRRGVARLVVQVLSAPTRAEATYRRRRVYAPVRGYLGKFASVQQALATTLPDGATQTQIANVVLPAKNVTAIAQRTVILPGRNLERPVTVANAQSPRIKLPVQYVRAPAPAPVLLPERDRIQLAAVAERFKRQQKLATRRAQRVAALATGKVAGQTAQTKANAETKVAASAASRPKPVERATTRVTRVGRAKASQLVAKAAAKPMATGRRPALPRLEAAAPPTTVIARPEPKWHQRFLGMNTGGA